MEQKQYSSECFTIQCRRNGMQLATQNNVRSIAFLNISTGNYHFLKDTTAKVAIRTVKDFLSYDNNIEKVTFVCIDNENYDAYQKLLNEKCVIARAQFRSQNPNELIYRYS